MGLARCRLSAHSGEMSKQGNAHGDDTRTCPVCGETIKAAVIKCWFFNTGMAVRDAEEDTETARILFFLAPGDRLCRLVTPMGGFYYVDGPAFIGITKRQACSIAQGCTQECRRRGHALATALFHRHWTNLPMVGGIFLELTAYGTSQV